MDIQLILYWVIAYARSVRVLVVVKVIDLIALCTVIQRCCNIAALLGNQKHHRLQITISLILGTTHTEDNKEVLYRRFVRYK